MPDLDLADQMQPISVTRRSGALAANAFFRISLEDDDDLRSLLPAKVVTIISPREATGAHANLNVFINGDKRKEFRVLGGANPLEVPGPIYSVEIQARDNAVGGSGDDDIQVIFTGRRARL